LDLRHIAELGRTDRREVLGMREQHGPGIADPVMKLDLAFGGLSLEIRGRVIDCECHYTPPSRGRLLGGNVRRYIGHRRIVIQVVPIDWELLPWVCGSAE